MEQRSSLPKHDTWMLKELFLVILSMNLRWDPGIRKFRIDPVITVCLHIKGWTRKNEH